MLAAHRRPTPPGSRWRRAVLLVPLAAALLVPLAASQASGQAAPAAPRAGSGSGGAADPGTYQNPLAPEVPDDGTVDSCADPTVLRGQAGEKAPDGQRYWYMYCTTDPLNDDDRNAEGDLIFNKIPMMRSTDLVDWAYVGNAFTKNPSWAAENAALWAPDVVYSSSTKRYYLFVTVTETTAAGGGHDTCGGDSAIGVATSTGPTGPWTFSDTPVVKPRLDPNGKTNDEGCRPYLWTFDPEVLGDTVATEGSFYFGSYYGGLFGAPITFAQAGATIGEQTRVAIGNRYEGPNVIERDGFYYLFASAANCCNTALTGYSVFVGRSSTPFGPFKDRQGNSFLAGRVGGTPFLSMNGNRWVGTGHNTVFHDTAGQWWTIYHAVDKTDPIFTGAFTKRPALLDPVDWIDGWPTVRGGRWASDTTMPAPAAQEGEVSRYETSVVPRHVLGRPLDTDEFSGTSLDETWEWVREPAADTYSVSRGALRWKTQAADLFVDSNNASVLTREAPKGDYVVETRVRVDVPPEGCCHNFVQGGLVVYGGDDDFIKLVNVSIFETRQTEFAKELEPVPAGWSRYGNSVVGPPGEWTWLRIVVERLSGDEVKRAGGDTEAYTAYTSQDGRTFVRGGTWTHSLGDARIGLVSMGGAGFTADFDHVRVYELKGGPRR